MKLGIFTDEISQDFPHAIAVAEEIGCSGVELRSMWKTSVQDLTPARTKEVRALLDEHSLECYNIAGPVFKCSIGSQREIDEHLDIVKRCCDAANEFGSPNIRAFTFWREEGVAVESVWGKLVELIAKAAGIAATAGKTLAIENEFSVLVAGGVMLARLMDEAGAPNIRAIWDPQNAIFDPEAEPPYPDGFEAVADRITFCHIKDGEPTPDGPKMLAVGEGKAMLAELVARLKRDGYTDYLSLETHWRPEGELDEATVRLPGGEAFSGPSAEAGSRLCMANLQRLIEEA